MSETEKRVPELRFKGFIDDWEQRKLGEVSEITKLAGFEFTKYVKYSDTGYIPAIRGLNVKNAKFVFNDVKYIDESDFSKLSRSKLFAGDIVFTYVGTIGEAAIIPESVTWYLAPNVARIRTTELNPTYLLQLLINPDFRRKEIETWIATSSQPALSMENIRKFEINFPFYEEQTKIGILFKQLDTIIALHQRKLTLLKQLKQTYLQMLFPQNDEYNPTLRFAGFSEPWEQRKFFDNIQNTIDFRGRTPKKLGMDWSGSGYLALSALNVKSGYIDPSADAHFGDEDLYNKWMGGRELRKGQVLFTTEAPMGNVAQVPDNKGYILSQRVIAFDVNTEKITDNFLTVLLRSPNVFSDLSALSSGGTAKGVSQKSLSGLKVIVPVNLREQEKIGLFFRNHDSTIALHQKKIDNMQSLKKVLLTKMFI